MSDLRDFIELEPNRWRNHASDEERKDTLEGMPIDEMEDALYRNLVLGTGGLSQIA